MLTAGIIFSPVERSTAIPRNKAIFLDLNGTIVEPVQVVNLSELKPIAGSVEALCSFTRMGFLLPVISVQSRISKGVFSREDFVNWFEVFSESLMPEVVLLGPYVCPHRFSEPCDCKKETGKLYRDAALDHDIALASSLVIGDTDADLKAARNLGIPGCLVRTGWGTYADESLASLVGNDLLDISEKLTAKY